LRAWSMIFARRSREIVSMIGEVTRWPYLASARTSDSWTAPSQP
jgi:hypothetical protein